MTTKFERQGTILRLVQQQPLSTQAEVAEALRAIGIETVQATVSRDIAQLGLVKVRNEEGRLVYALPGRRRPAAAGRADERASPVHGRDRIYSGDDARDQDPSRLRGRRSPTRSTTRRCPRWPGTIAGDNTVFVAARDGLSAADLDAHLRSHL